MLVSGLRGIVHLRLTYQLRIPFLSLSYHIHGTTQRLPSSINRNWVGVVLWFFPRLFKGVSAATTTISALAARTELSASTSAAIKLRQTQFKFLSGFSAAIASRRHAHNVLVLVLLPPAGQNPEPCGI